MNKSKKIKISGSFKKKRSKKEWHLRFLEERLEHIKRVYETYIEVFVEYHISEVAYSAISSQELLDNDLTRKLKELRGKRAGFRNFMFGDGKKLSKEQKIERGIKHYERLISVAQGKIKMFDHETKVKIAKDSIEKQDAWLRIDIQTDKKEVKNGI